jgi:uncharacterized protein
VREGDEVISFLSSWAESTWHLLAESSIYVLFGLLIGGFLRVFLSPGMVARHLGRGRFSSVFKASLLGIPMPLCSCGVLPAGASLKKQGANNGATTAFLISTPETGVDSIAITYALLGPIMAVARPIAAFLTASVAGIAENIVSWKRQGEIAADLSCPIDGCCDGVGCDPALHRRHHSMREKLTAGLRFAFGSLWADLAGWFAVGIVLAGLIGALVPDELLARYLGGGWQAMLIMLGVGIPLYICATASTPIAAMLILKGVSPGAALVFLLAGPATNLATMSVLLGVLGRRATAIYITSIAVMSVACGLALDAMYGWLGISAQATLGQATELFPAWAQSLGALLIIGLSVKPIVRDLQARITGKGHNHPHDEREQGEESHHDSDEHRHTPKKSASCAGST